MGLICIVNSTAEYHMHRATPTLVLMTYVQITLSWGWVVMMYLGDIYKLQHSETMAGDVAFLGGMYILHHGKDGSGWVMHLGRMYILHHGESGGGDVLGGM